MCLINIYSYIRYERFVSFFRVGVGMFNKKYILTAILILSSQLFATTISVHNPSTEPIVSVDKDGNVTVDISLLSSLTQKNAVNNSNTIINNNRIHTTQTTHQEKITQAIQNQNTSLNSAQNSNEELKKAWINRAYGALAVIAYIKMPPFIILSLI